MRVADRVVDSVIEMPVGNEVLAVDRGGLRPETIYGYVVIVTDRHGLYVPSPISYGKTLI